MNRNYTNLPNGGDEANNGREGQDDKAKKFVVKKSAVPIFAVGLSFILMSAVFPVSGFFSFAINVIVASFAHKAAKKLFPDKKVELKMLGEAKTEPIETTLADEPKLQSERSDRGDTERLLLKIDRYNDNIKLLNEAISDGFISDELYGIEGVIEKIKSQLKEYKSEGGGDEKSVQLEQFFDYYMPTIIKILNSYRRIEKNNLTGENAVQTKKKIIETLPVIRRAFEKELDNMFSAEMLDITTDIVVLESMLSKDGLIDGINIKKSAE